MVMEMEGGNQRKQIIYMWLISNEIIRPPGDASPP